MFVVQAMEITQYSRFICGYHLRTDERAVLYRHDPSRYCALDWYNQSSAQRLQAPSVWDHYLLRDVVDPFNWYTSNTSTWQGQYRGWDDFEVGAEGY